MTGRLTFGTELRRRRQLAQLSLTQLGAQVHYSKSYLSKVESGRPVQPEFARLCDAVLKANGELIALARDATEQAGTEPEVRHPGTGSWTMSLEPDGTGLFTPIAGHDPADASTAVFGLAMAGGRYPADPVSMLAVFRARFEQTRAMGQMTSAHVMLPMVITDTHALRGVASGMPRDVSAGLWRLAAQYAEYAGWMCEETGNVAHAMYWTDMAVEMSLHAGDESLRPYGLFRRADVALYADDAYGTLELARMAQADPAATTRVRGLAMQREAQGHAMLGEFDLSQRVLDRSTALLAEAAAQAPAATPVLGAWAAPDPMVMVRGWCLYDAGRPAEAAALLEPGIGRFADGVGRARARYAVRTALAYAAADEIERACEIVERIVDDLRRIDSATVRHDVTLIIRELRRRAGQPRVRELLPILADLQRGSANRDRLPNQP